MTEVLATSIDHLASWVVVLTAVVGVSGTLGGAGALIANFRRGARAETVQLQTEEIDAQRQRIDTLTEEKRQLAQDLANQGTELRRLKIELDVLKELVTQAAKVDQLREELGGYHGEMATVLNRLTAAMETLAKQPPAQVTVTPAGGGAIVGGKRASDPQG